MEPKQALRHVTHEVENQPPPLVDTNLYETDRCLMDAVARGGADWHEDALRAFGALLGSERVIALGRDANRFAPILHTHDRFGHRIDEVEFHPAWHALMALAMEHQVHCLPWREERPGSHVARAALAFMLNQAESGVCCPMAMTFASLPALRHQPDVAAEWEPRITQAAYDPRYAPAAGKTAATIGMAMTEKQGGSDVRANATRAEPAGPGGPGAEYRLTGHKWFCSAPMSDAFLTLAYAKGGLSCFLVPRWRPDGSRNAILIQRLKDKLGNRSNASSEIEYHGATAMLIGEEGRGVATIIEMVHHTRLDAAVSAAGIMRQALAQAAFHARHRSAFQKRLVDQPLMRQVLADLALECEAATTLVMRLARAFDAGAGDPAARAFARIATAIAKYWVCKRAPGMFYEALECHGGSGYVEESIMPRLYREAPVNSIWEGCGNVMCLDILRALAKDPGSGAALAAELDSVKGADAALDRAAAAVKAALTGGSVTEADARRLAEQAALVLQGTILVRDGNPAVAEAFIQARLGASPSLAYGGLPPGIDPAPLLERISPTP